MPRYIVEYNNKCATFSNVTESFLTRFFPKEAYMKNIKYMFANKDSHRTSIEDAIFHMGLNKTRKEVKRIMEEIGLTKEEIENIISKVDEIYYRPIPIPASKSKYKCPNCKKIIKKGQETCPEESCNLRFVWQTEKEE